MFQEREILIKLKGQEVIINLENVFSTVTRIFYCFKLCNSIIFFFSEEWIYSLAYQQFTPEEFNNGTAIEILMDKGIL